MATMTFDDVLKNINEFSYSEKKTLFEALKKSLKKTRKPKIKLAKGNDCEPVHTMALMGILKGSTVTLEEARDERLARQ